MLNVNTAKRCKRQTVGMDCMDWHSRQMFKRYSIAEVSTEKKSQTQSSRGQDILKIYLFVVVCYNLWIEHWFSTQCTFIHYPGPLPPHQIKCRLTGFHICIAEIYWLFPLNLITTFPFKMNYFPFWVPHFTLPLSYFHSHLQFHLYKCFWFEHFKFSLWI